MQKTAKKETSISEDIAPGRSYWLNQTILFNDVIIRDMERFIYLIFFISDMSKIVETSDGRCCLSEIEKGK